MNARPSRWALVTGASAGIGRAFALRLARDGYGVILVARRRDSLDVVAGEMRRTGGVAEVLPADLGQPDDLRRVEARIAADDVHLLVNNAALVHLDFLGIDGDDLEKMLRVNVIAPTRLARAAAAGMVARGSGAIVNVSSAAAFRPRTGLASAGGMGALPLSGYGASKAYLVALSQRLHEEFSPAGVLVQALCPGFVHSRVNDIGEVGGLVAAEDYLQPEEVVQASLQSLALGESVCLPALENSAALDLLDRVYATLALQGGWRGGLARRYRDGTRVVEDHTPGPS